MTGIRTFVDSQGVEWEVYDESDWGVRGLLDWDYLPQQGNPGLLFMSRADLRRLWPAPDGWQVMSDADLADQCVRALSVY